MHANETRILITVQLKPKRPREYGEFIYIVHAQVVAMANLRVYVSVTPAS